LEGLCPACLLRQGPETGPPLETIPFQPPTVEEVARLFPHLEIIGFIGKGGMGAVYQARQSALDRLVALKILPPQAAGGPAFAERFGREARALARLNHPNIVGVYEFGQAGQSPFFVMEFVDGLTLRQLEQAGRLSPGEALQIVPQICDALQYAHDQGIVHRDIKPENILIDKKGRVKIADFGIAKIIGGDAGSPAMSATRHALGTPHYMAPEQVEQPQTVDHRADIFSLGVVFYEMLTGQLPLGRFAPPSRKVEIDVRLDEVVLRALEQEPGLRYQQAGEVKTQIDTISSTPGQAGKSAKAAADPPSDRRVFARQALWCLVVGLLGCPFLNALHASEDATVTFGASCLLLALVFGIISWHERLGRIIAITVMALGTVSLILGLIFSLVYWREEVRLRADEETREKEAQTRAVEHQRVNRSASHISQSTPDARAIAEGQARDEAKRLQNEREADVKARAATIAVQLRNLQNKEAAFEAVYPNRNSQAFNPNLIEIKSLQAELERLRRENPGLLPTASTNANRVLYTNLPPGFRGYAVNRTMVELGDRFDLSTPESALASVVVRCDGDITELLNKATIDSHPATKVMWKWDDTNLYTDALERNRVTGVLVFQDDLACVINSLAKTGRFGSGIAGLQGGQWKLLWTDFPDETLTEEGAITQFERVAPAFRKKFQEFANQPQTAAAPPLENQLSNALRQLNHAIGDTVRQMAAAHPGNGGGSITISSPFGGPPLQYQWQQQGTNFTVKTNQ
jgi:serine/threonine protein kinase